MNSQQSSSGAVDAATVLANIAKRDGLHLPATHRVSFRKAGGGTGNRDYATHWIHSYPAKMFHLIPQTILASLADAPRSLVVLDPFCGSGTVLLESMLKGHTALGIDVNPLARLISDTKTCPIDSSHLKVHLAGILRRARKRVELEHNATLAYWFKGEVRSSLSQLMHAIRGITHDSCRRFFTVTLSSIVRRCSFADPSIPPPVRLSAERAAFANDRYQRDLIRALTFKAADVFTLFEEAATNNLTRMAELCDQPHLGHAKILGHQCEATNTALPDRSVDLVVTSPPYCGAQKYVRTTRLEMLIIGIPEEEIAAADKRTLGTERLTPGSSKLSVNASSGTAQLVSSIHKVNSERAEMLTRYVNYLYNFAAELNRVLKSGSDAFVTFGTNRIAGVDVDCSRIFAHAAKTCGMSHINTLVDSIPSRGLMTSRHRSAATIQDERVVWLRAL